MLFPAKREALKVRGHRVALQKSLRQKYAALQPEQQEPRLKGGNGMRYISLQRLGHGKKLILRRSIGCENLWWPGASFSPTREEEKRIVLQPGSGFAIWSTEDLSIKGRRSLLAIPQDLVMVFDVIRENPYLAMYCTLQYMDLYLGSKANECPPPKKRNSTEQLLTFNTSCFCSGFIFVASLCSFTFLHWSFQRPTKVTGRVGSRRRTRGISSVTFFHLLTRGFPL